MLVKGNWFQSTDGLFRPIIRGEIMKGDRTWMPISFLLDTGADRTILSANILRALRLSALPAPFHFGGVGGLSATVLVRTQLQFPCDGSGSSVLFRGDFAGFSDPNTLDMSLLGRDVCDVFSVIVDRPGNFVGLVGQRHRYIIQQD